MNEAVFHLGELAAPVTSTRKYSATRVFAIALGAFLIVTALLKAVSPAQSALLEAAYDLPRWAVILAVQVELLVAVLLLADLWARATRVTAIVLFSAFAAFSLYRALAGYESCGCFGSIAVSPWWTFAMDVTIAAILLGQRHQIRDRQALPATVAKLLTSASIFIGLAVASLYAMLAVSPATVAAEGALLGDGRLVVLEPNEWIDKEFPLHKFVSAGVDLRQGEWVVLFFHHDCPECQAALPRYEALAASMAARGDATHVLLLEVPPYGEIRSGNNPAAYARLSDEREWFVQAPVEIRLNDGRVTGASLDLPSAAVVP